MATTPAPNLFGSTNDADLQDIITQLSSGLTNQELSAAGLGMEGAPQSAPDWFQDPVKGGRSYAGLKQASLLQQYSWHKQSKKQLEKSRAFNAAQKEGADNYAIQRQARLDAAKRELQVRNTKNQINGYFASDKMTGLYDSLRSNILQNSIADIINKYQDQLRDSAFQTAGQGLTGSTVDAERRGDIDKAQNADAIKASGDADSYVQNVKDQNDQQRRSLVDTLSSDNPGDAASLEQQTRGIPSNTQHLSDQYANQAANNQISQAGYGMQSQALGNLLSNAANLYSTGQNAKAYGGGSAF